VLVSLSIRDFAIVRNLDLSLEPGMTALTGETGAGKSILIDALALVLGERADAAAVRHGAESAEIVAGFELSANGDAAAWLAGHELEAEGECLLRRVVIRDKPTRAFINGRPATTQMLRELGALLVDIHGQHEHHSLLSRGTQRQVLDDSAGLGAEAGAVARCYREWAARVVRRDELARVGADREAKLALLSYQIEELRKLAPPPGEFSELEQEHVRLAHAAELRAGLHEARELLTQSEENALAPGLARLTEKLSTLQSFDSRLNNAVTALNDARVQIEDAAVEIGHLADRVELDPERLTEVEQRLSLYLQLARKHRSEPSELHAVLAQLAAEHESIAHAGETLDHLAAEIAGLRKDYDKLAGALSQARQKAAAVLSERISAQMRELGMAGGRFFVSVAPEAAAEPDTHGMDRIEFLVSANPGQPLAPLARVASGGELSRISLGIQVVTAAAGRVPTLIFDEVDSGIGGAVAEKVGQKLRALGRTRQAMCITHLAQVAAQAHHHLQVTKKKSRNDVEVAVAPLADTARVQELARMLGGVQITDRSIAHAADMLERAGP
jgi:DNA repair protein RecN (Recombination protein N)